MHAWGRRETCIDVATHNIYHTVNLMYIITTGNSCKSHRTGVPGNISMYLHICTYKWRNQPDLRALGASKTLFRMILYRIFTHFYLPHYQHFTHIPVIFSVICIFSLISPLCRTKLISCFNSRLLDSPKRELLTCVC